jgi:hypothetical protein
MKLKMIVAATAALCTTGAFAATSSCPNPAVTADDLVNKCAPEISFYFGGASAQEPAVIALMDDGGNGIFDVTKPRVKITAAAGATGIGAKNSTAWLGWTPAGKRAIVIYNKANGSGAGVLQLLNGLGTPGKPTAAGYLADNDEMITLATQNAKGAAAGTPATCVLGTAATPAPGAAGVTTGTCASYTAFTNAWAIDKQKIMHMALSDVKPLELTPGLIKSFSPAKNPIVATAVQGFGVIVSPSLYTAMIAKQVAAGQLPSTCTTSETVTRGAQVVSAACQPTIFQADYAALISGGVKSAKGLVGAAADADAPITVFRRVKFSGTQAASNIFFAGQAGYIAKTPLVDGFMDVTGTTYTAGIPTDADVPATATNFVTTLVKAGTGDVINGVSAATGYAIGVVSTENVQASDSTSVGLKGALYVKLNGVSPNADATGKLAYLATEITGAAKLTGLNRHALLNGYPMVFEMQAIDHAKLAGLNDQKDIAAKIKAGLADSTKSDLNGVAYLNAGAAANKAATYGRYLGNNTAPLLLK